MKTFSTALDFLVEKKAYDKCHKVLGIMERAYLKLNQSQRLHQVPTMRVILFLADNDIPAADHEFTAKLGTLEGWGASRDCELAEELIAAFRAADPAKLEEVHALPVWGFLPNRVSVRRVQACAGRCQSHGAPSVLASVFTWCVSRAAAASAAVACTAGCASGQVAVSHRCCAVGAGGRGRVRPHGRSEAERHWRQRGLRKRLRRG